MSPLLTNYAVLHCGITKCLHPMPFVFVSHVERPMRLTGLTVVGAGAVYLRWNEGEHHKCEASAGVSHCTFGGERKHSSLVRGAY